MMGRGEALARLVAALVLCALCAWATDALLQPASVLAIGALFMLC